MGNSLPSVAHEAKKGILVSEGTKTKLQFLKLKVCQLNKSKKTKHGCDMSMRDALKSVAIPADQANYEVQKKGVMRVKVVLTKKEAAQLLAMCVKGDQDKVIAKVVDELERVDAARGRMSSYRGAWRPSLASIPEDAHT